MEIYRNTESTIPVIVPALECAEYSVTISSPDSKVEPVTVPLAQPGEDGRTNVTIPFQHALYDGPVKLDFNITRGDNNYSIQEVVDVVTPMFTWHDLDGSYEREQTPEL